MLFESDFMGFLSFASLRTLRSVEPLRFRAIPSAAIRSPTCFNPALPVWNALERSDAVVTSFVSPLDLVIFPPC
jgi:hypothetical protein